KFLPFFKDRRKEGIEQIKQAITEGSVVNDLAAAALVFVYYEQSNGAAGLPVAQGLVGKYPQNVIMKNLSGNFLSLLGKNSEAQANLDEVLKSAPEINVARYFKGMAYYRAGDRSNAKQSFESFLQNKPSPAWQAYAHYMLGTIALQEKNPDQAWDHFKAGEKAYGKFTPNLKMILKMRRGEN